MANPADTITVLYAAFDAYPGFKGAQTHIRANLRSLAGIGGRATLLCLGAGGSFQDPDSGAMVHSYAAGEANMLRRSESFGRFLECRADKMMDNPPSIIHFRDIWSGIPLLSHKLSQKSRLVFEVNGLPSVELPSHYPRLARNTSLLARLRRMEDECLARADRIITVCRRTACYLAERGCDDGKIVVIPNATDAVISDEDLRTKAAPSEAAAASGKMILYTGTLAPWQGLYTLLEAAAHLGHRNDFSLLVAASGKKGIPRLRKYIKARGLKERVTIFTGVHHRTMPALYERAYFSLAPLTRGARNELQGCCPLKIIESMACGTPVVASDLPAVRELIRSGDDGILVPPDSPRALAGAMESLLDDKARRDRLAGKAQQRAQQDFKPKLLAERLGTVYNFLSGGQ